MTCSVGACGRPVRCSGLCAHHYQREQYAKRRAAGGHTPPRPDMLTCDICGVSYKRPPQSRSRYCSTVCARTARDERRRLADYGVTVDEFNALLERQVGVCAICRQPERARGNGHLSVDHDHMTGRVRGLLCRSCNAALGHFADDAERLLAAADYLAA